MSLHAEWVRYPTGKIKKGTICPKCARYNSRHIVCHSLVLKGGKVLLVKRDVEPKRGWWAIPGGYLDWGESVAECSLRELYEEAGVRGKAIRLLEVNGDPKRDEDKRQNVGIFYLVEALNEGGKTEEVTEAKWFDLDKLPKKIAFDHRKMIERYKIKSGQS